MPEYLDRLPVRAQAQHAFIGGDDSNPFTPGSSEYIEWEHEISLLERLELAQEQQKTYGASQVPIQE